MKTNDIYTDALDGFAKLTGNPELPAGVRELEARCRFVRGLTRARCRAGFGLDDFAARMGVPRAELERIEEGTDADLSMNQIAAYVLALVSALPARPGTAEEAPPAPARKTASRRPSRSSADGRATRKRTVALS